MHGLPKLVAGLILSALNVDALANCTIYVSHNGDASAAFWTFANGSDNQMLFREAAEVGYGVARCYTSFEKDRIVGGIFVNDPVFCGTLDSARNWRLAVGNPGCGPSNADTIMFWDGINGGPTINLGARVVVDPRDSIDGAGARPNIALVGPGAGGSAANVGAISFENFSDAATGSVRNLYIDSFRGFAIRANYVNGLAIKGVAVSRISGDSSGFAYGVVLGEYTGPAIAGQCVFGAQIGGVAAGEQNYFFDIADTAISIWDTCSGDNSDRNNKIFNNYIGICEELDTGVGLDGCATGTLNQGIGQFGIRIVDTPNTRVGGSSSNEANFVARSSAAGVVVAGTRSRDTRIQANQIGLSRTGFTRANGAGVWLQNGAYQNQIGGLAAGEGNVISGNSQHAVRINAGAANSVAGNVIGLNAARTQARGNGIDGVAINGGSTNAEVVNNVIGNNGGWGVYADGGSGHSIRGNVIGLRGSANTANDNTAAPNAGGGVWINNVPGNTISADNRVAGNTGTGILIHGENADGNTVRGNIIGLANDFNRRPNNVGVLIQGGADDTVVGGAVAADSNTISGNTFEGVRIKDAGTTGTLVRSNYIGTSPTGNVAEQNAVRGVVIDSGAAATQILNNYISGNGVDGVALIGAGNPSLIQGNIVGLAANGAALPNSASGIALAAGTTGAVVGSNIIAANASFGVFVADSGTNGNTITANTIGSGSASLANAAGGITIRAGASSNVVSANIVIGHDNGPGIEIGGAHNNTVIGNRVGLNGADVSIGNLYGVILSGAASGNSIGGSALADRNFVSGNALYGITLIDAGTVDNLVLNNYVGVDVLGSSARANGLGVVIGAGASDNSLALNLISGNSSDGVLIQTAGTGNQVQRNRIGLAATGSAFVANGGHGVHIAGNSNGAFIGGLPVQANSVAGNGGAGLRVESGAGNDLGYNSVFANAGLGIDLGTLGVTANDPLDADAGANGLQNFPILSNVVQNGATVSLTVTQTGLVSTPHSVLVYANSACDPSGNGEGETLLDGATLTTNAAGVGVVNLMLPLPSALPVVAFTATSSVTVVAGTNTSEFSPCVINGAVQNPIFANGFEPASQLQAKSALQAGAFSSIERLGADTALLSLVLDPLARSFTISSDRAVIVESIRSAGVVCELLGAIVCEMPTLANGPPARVWVRLSGVSTGLTLAVIEVRASGVAQDSDPLRADLWLAPAPTTREESTATSQVRPLLPID